MASKYLLTAIPALPFIGGAVVLAEILYAAHRPDLPSLDNQDPSGVFGDPTLAPLRVAALGDSSITAPGVEPLDHAWVRRVAHHLSDRFHVTLRNFAVGGSKARDVLADQVPEAIAWKPDLVLISVGANDAIRATPLRRYRKELDAIVGAMHDVADAVAVAGVGNLGSIPRLPTVSSMVSKARARAYDDVIAEVVMTYPRARKADAWGPVFAPFDGPEAASYFAPDMFHANAQGHGLFAQAAIPMVDTVLRFVEPKA